MTPTAKAINPILSGLYALLALIASKLRWLCPRAAAQAEYFQSLLNQLAALMTAFKAGTLVPEPAPAPRATPPAAKRPDSARDASPSPAAPRPTLTRPTSTDRAAPQADAPARAEARAKPPAHARTPRIGIQDAERRAEPRNSNFLDNPGAPLRTP